MKAASSKSRPQSNAQPQSAGIPDEPRFRFKGGLQSGQFSMGVEAFRALLEQSESVIGLDDREFAERYAELLLTTMTTGGDFGLGFAAALANWIAIGRHSSQPIQTWIPLYTPPRHRIVNDGDYYEPPARSLLFELDGAAVCVTEELAAYRFGPSDVDDIDVDDVRERGKAISRDRFDELRDWDEAHHG